MKYYFESKVEKRNSSYVIPVPFNVWEVCKQREEITGELALDNRVIPCELFPLEKGNYEIHIAADDAAALEQDVMHKILLHITSTLVGMAQDSPYSPEHPIRKIDSMEVILQKQDGLCGQACVAMLAGSTIADVAEAMGCNEWQATMGRMISALNYFGIDHSDIIVYTQGRPAQLPKCCIMMEKMGRYCHYLVHYDGKYYDPNLGVLDDYDMGKLQGYLEIKC